MPATVNVTVTLTAQLINATPTQAMCFNPNAFEVAQVFLQPGNIPLGTVTIVQVQQPHPVYSWWMTGSALFAMPNLPVGSYQLTSVSGLDTSPSPDMFSVVPVIPPAETPEQKAMKMLPILSLLLSD